jgi:hypothetical protein
MTGLPAFFEQTSDEPYDRHNYRLVLSDGRTIESDVYEDIKAAWFQLPALFTSHIEVLDKPRTTKPQGF